MKTTNVFSYGSNLSHARIQKRVPSARFLTCGFLSKHALRWHKPGRDGSGKCDAFFTGVQSDIVWGGVFSLLTNEKHLLDKVEGLGIGYSEMTAHIECVKLVGSETAKIHLVPATFYKAIPIDPVRKPYGWYKDFVVQGARECGLPESYIAELDAVEEIVDQDAQRDAMNRSILNATNAI